MIMLGKFFSREYYLEAATEQLKSFRENDKACLKIHGHRINTATKARILNHIAFLRRRYTGKEDLPEIKFVKI